MPLPANNNNKDTYPLLDLSSDGSEDLHLEITPVKKKKLQRKNRPRGVARSGEPPLSRPSPWQRSARYTCWLLALAWLLVLTFTTSALNQRLKDLDNQLRTVSSGNDVANDILQACHTDTKSLQANASALARQLAALAARHDALRDNYTGTAAELASLQAKLAKMPDLMSPQEPHVDLVSMVGEMGSKLSGIDLSVKTALETAAAAKRGLAALEQVLNTTGRVANASAAERQELTEHLKKLSLAFEGLNETIAKRLDATELKLKEYASELSSDKASIEKLGAQIHPLPATTAASLVKDLDQQVRRETKPAPTPASTASAAAATATLFKAKPVKLESGA